MKQARNLVLGLAAAIAFQVIVLVGEYVSAVLPLWTGREIRVKTVPVDPRSMFRGNYARLNYDISLIDAFELAGDLRNGEIIYVRLKPDTQGSYIYAGASLTQPEEGVFLRGRLANRHYDDGLKRLRIKYGIEAYFAPKEKALALERQLREEAVSVLMVADNGKAALKEVIAK